MTKGKGLKRGPKVVTRRFWKEESFWCGLEAAKNHLNISPKKTRVKLHATHFCKNPKTVSMIATLFIDIKGCSVPLVFQMVSWVIQGVSRAYQGFSMGFTDILLDFNRLQEILEALQGLRGVSSSFKGGSCRLDNIPQNQTSLYLEHSVASASSRGDV